LVDLHGPGAGARPAILARRPAPVQIAWLGHAGTSAMAGIDYVLADAVVLPPALAPYFSEQPLYLPATFQIGDRQRIVGPRPRRAACGLPAKGFVFCCFSAAGLLAPEHYASWMRILRRVPGSVLWLAVDSEAVRDRLRVAALRHNVASDRLVFAASLHGPGHLARLQLAGLALDTQPCSDGAAGADALWAGVPLLSSAGRGFAARVGASLLHAAGLPELVVDGGAAFEDMAVKLSQSPRKLGALRNRLKRERDSSALFDSPALVRNLERLYLRVAHGAPPSGDADAAPLHPDAGLPLVSILIAAGAPARGGADALERSLRGAVAQDYGHVEIIVSDSSGDDAVRDRVAPWLARHPQLRYCRAPGLAPDANLDHCLALALGQYIAVTPPGDTLQPQRLTRMMAYYQRYPGVGLVAGWRRPWNADADTQGLPGAPLFGVDTVIGGASLGALLLSADGAIAAALSDPGALLLRRDAIGAGFGHYLGQRYRALAGVATALSALPGRDCVYLPEPLSSSAPVPAGAAAAQGADLLARCVDSLRLLYGAHAQQAFLPDAAQFKPVLAARLAATTAMLSARHAALAGMAPTELEQLQLVLREGYRLLLS
ncbi:glycosyltransferase, partial [Rugamonas sp.]|uniref:O-linked N-acetylglucosamine transferase family protein n=1 Tax=Rugamonas sp. TaxID=1926287 RepID=UPI0025DD8BD2